MYGGYRTVYGGVQRVGSQPRSRPRLALAGVAEGPVAGIMLGDALARAQHSPRQPTGDRQMNNKRIL